jgi:hypothetical protein
VSKDPINSDVLSIRVAVWEEMPERIGTKRMSKLLE